MNSERRHLSPQEKVAALKRHLLENVPVSTICDQLGIAPTLFYRWQKELFELAEQNQILEAGTVFGRGDKQTLTSAYIASHCVPIRPQDEHALQWQA